MLRSWASESRGGETETITNAPNAMHRVAIPMSHFVESQTLSDVVAKNNLNTNNMRPVKRRRSSTADAPQSSLKDASSTAAPWCKRLKLEPINTNANTNSSNTLSQPQQPTSNTRTDTPALKNVATIERSQQVIHHQFGLEILLKHDELRLINQELAKCQVALEQLRRCHLIPYPINSPTPQQMLDIATGKGSAVDSSALSGKPIPRWASPYGVADGPYSRHYAKWLIPDPMFDAVEPLATAAVPCAADKHAKLGMPDSRSMRKSGAEPLSAAGKRRAARGAPSSRLHSLSSGYGHPKEKPGPCVLKRSDGQVVKLVCLDCKRQDFSSTQGFINHCRIAHKRDFKSHEEAAVQCGHPYDVNESGPLSQHIKPLAATGASVIATSSAAAAAAARPVITNSAANTITTPSIPPPPPPPVTGGLTNIYARSDMTEQHAYASLRQRLHQTLKLYGTEGLPALNAIPPSNRSSTKARASKEPEMDHGLETPHLSRLLQHKKVERDFLADAVKDAKTVDIDHNSSDESDVDASPLDTCSFASQSSPERASSGRQASVASPAPCIMRMPARRTKQPSESTDDGSASSSSSSVFSRPRILTSLTPPAIPFVPSMKMDGQPESRTPDQEMDLDSSMDMHADLSPNTAISNNAPSLVSDDGEYDDSDDASSDLDNQCDDDGSSISGSVADMAEITIEEGHGSPRTMRHHHHHHHDEGGSSAGCSMDYEKQSKQQPGVPFVGSAVGPRGKGRPRRKP